MYYNSSCVKGVGQQQTKKQSEEHKKASSEKKNDIEERGYKENIDNWLMRHAQNIKHAHDNSNDDKVQMKYSWLSSYHNKITDIFTKNPDCRCLID